MRVVLALTLTILASCVGATAADKVIVFAAASLKGPLDQVAADYQVRSGTEIVVSYAASSALAKQIEQGAPAAIFVSADLEWMDYLATKGGIDLASRKILLRNQLVLIAGADGPKALKIEPNFELLKVLGNGRLAMADPDAVPAGKYAKAALISLGVWASVENKIARAENVRAALAFVSRGEAPLGIVYRTDALAEPKVRQLDVFPENTHPPIIYPVAKIKGAVPSADAFMQALTGPEALAVFQRAGFLGP